MNDNTNIGEQVALSIAPKTIDGAWTVTIHGPTGPQETTLILNSINGALTGTQSAMDQVEDANEITYDSDTGELAWINKIKKPLPLTLKFSGVVEGESISGHVTAAIMGKFPFTGRKKKS